MSEYNEEESQAQDNKDFFKIILMILPFSI
jgi:hypothetical protein